MPGLPKVLYKYFAFNEYNLNSLNEGKFWLADSVNQNDPMDSPLRYDHSRGDSHALLRNLRAYFSNQLDYHKFNHNKNGDVEYYKNGFHSFSCASDQLKKINKKDFIRSDAHILFSGIDPALKFSFFLNHNGKGLRSNFCAGFEPFNIDDSDAHYLSVIEQDIAPGICCFSRDNTNSVMWAHYAENHHGLCVCFEVDQDLATSTISNFFLRKVEYSRDLPPVIKIKGIGSDELISSLTQQLSTKHLTWRYEKEYRFISFDKNSRLLEFPGKIRSITFGARMTTAREKIVRKLVTSDVIFSRASFTSTSYAMRITELHKEAF
ncbi:MAG: DUF2971 domain-containing protein [Proteobacteria bacterium]|nr:MAG: DUF2971 domain-containing protein [Pseudomonadota bacterium]